MLHTLHELTHVLGLCPEVFGFLTLNDYITDIKFSLYQIKVLWLKSL